jgi:hypothetical protein
LDPCAELKHLTSKCYTASTRQDVEAFIDREFEETLMLIKFLEKRGSTLPAKLMKNSWAIFTN